MATTKLLPASRTTVLAVASPSSSSFSITSRHTSSSTTFSTRLNKVGYVDREKRFAETSGGGGERKSVVVTSAVSTSENALTTKTHTGSGGVDLAFLVHVIKMAGITSLKVVTRKRPWRLIVQMFIEKVIIDCRFFTMLAVAGSMLGSVLCFLEKLPSWVGIGSITEAKSKIGHALMMILQVGVLEKFKSIPMASGLDLACFAGAVFVSSACIFLLSKLSLTAS
ncbi:hypothetical protein LguiB_020032 [Lonicera macranthoides]